MSDRYNDALISGKKLLVLVEIAQNVTVITISLKTDLLCSLV